MPTGKYIKTKEHREKLRLANLGKKHTEERKKNLSIAWEKTKNRKRNWKGGITPLIHKLRTNKEYISWQKSVLERDNFTCVWCGYKKTKKGDLHADHIKPFRLFSELRYCIDNGRTLCAPCHRTTYKNYWENKDN